MLSILTINIGNTNINMGVFKGNRLLWRFAIPTNTKNYSPIIRKIVNKYKIKDSILCSVVPKSTKAISRGLVKLINRKPILIGKDIRVPIINNYRNPNQAGQDRLVNAYAGLFFYGAPLIIIDSGTAITFDVVSKDRVYLGGLIFPGMNISLEALNEKTALLPKIKLKPPETLIGRDTKNSILSGVVFGTASLCRELVSEIKQRIGKDAMVIGTGGGIHLIKKYSGIKIKIDTNLTLKGIKLIYKHKRPGVRFGFCSVRQTL